MQRTEDLFGRDDLFRCFPASLHPDLARVIDPQIIGYIEKITLDSVQIAWGNTTYSVLSRLYCTLPSASKWGWKFWSNVTPEDRLASLTDTQRNLHACLLSTHTNGHVREQFTKHIAPIADSFAMPFLLHALGDYALSVALPAIERISAPSMIQPIRDFIAANPAFFELTKQRAISYWNEYHSANYPRMEDYPPLRCLRTLTLSESERNGR